jgi:putative ABC transport system permease protein
MFSLDKWQEILHTIKQNKLRTALTAFGVFWGILMLILLLGAGNGLQGGVKNSFSGDAQDSMWIFPRKTSLPYQGLAPGRQLQFTEDDLAALKRLPGVGKVVAENTLGPFWGGGSFVTYRQKTSGYLVSGVSEDFLDLKLTSSFVYGRDLNALDEKEVRKVVILGTRVVEILFEPETDPTGEYVNINGVPFLVVGVFYDSGRQGRNSERSYIPLTTFQKTFGKGRIINLFGVMPAPGIDGFALEKEVLNTLRARHRVASGDERAIFVNNLAKEAQSFRNLFISMNILIWFVGIGTLAAGIVGISNIMIITVRDRTVEIGIRKALGATPLSIVGLILLESVALTTLAGYLGLVTGVGVLEGIAYLMQTLNVNAPYFARPEVGFGTAVAATALLVVVGAIAGLLPALKAAGITPIAAMRAGA